MNAPFFEKGRVKDCRASTTEIVEGISYVGQNGGLRAAKKHFSNVRYWRKADIGGASVADYVICNL